MFRSDYRRYAIMERSCTLTQQSIYFLCHLRSFGVRKHQILLLFYRSVIISILQCCNSIWYKSLSVMLKTKLYNQLKICSKIVGQPLEKLYDSAYHNNLLRLANIIASNPMHILDREFELLPSKRRYRVPKFNKVRLKHSFFHQAILALNKSIQSEIKSTVKVLDV